MFLAGWCTNWCSSWRSTRLVYVKVFCLLGRDVTVLQVLRHLLPRAFPRVPVAAPVPRHQAHDVVLLEAQACHLAEHLLMPVFADDLYVVARPFLPAGHAPGR